MAFLYTDIATNQRDGLNFPGGTGSAGTGGLTTQPGGFNDPIFELGTLSMITAVYTMTGNEAQNDIIYIARVGQGVLVDPVDSNIAGNGIGTTAEIQVGDTDTVGGTVAPNQTRYSTALNVAADMSATTGVKFAGGATLITPASITDDNPSGPSGTPPANVANQVWITGKFSTLTVPVAGKKAIFRIKLADNR